MHRARVENNVFCFDDRLKARFVIGKIPIRQFNLINKIITNVDRVSWNEKEKQRAFPRRKIGVKNGSTRFSIAQRGLRFFRDLSSCSCSVIINHVYYGGSTSNVPSWKVRGRRRTCASTVSTSPPPLTYTHRRSNCVLEFPPSYSPNM